MSVATINGFVLFPHRANYGTEPTWERRWESQVADSEFGSESRTALRAVPRVMIRWGVTSRDIAEQSQLMDRIVAARRSGRACSPMWGRGSELASTVTGAAVSLEPTLWNWREGDFAFFVDDAGNFDCIEVAAVGVNSLTLLSPVSRSYHSGNYIWPLIFGRFGADNVQALTARNGQCSLSITELTSRDAETVGATTPGGEGVGSWIIEDDNEVQ